MNFVWVERAAFPGGIPRWTLSMPEMRRQSGGSGGYNQQQFNQNKPFLSGGFLDNSVSQNQGGNPTTPPTKMNLRSQQKTPEQTSPIQQIPSLFAGNNYQQTPPVAPPAPDISKVKADDFSQDDAVMTPVEKGTESSGGGDEKTSRQRILGLSKRKITNKERRIRQNRRLRKMLTPKNAIVALHELQGPSALDFQIEGVNNDFRAEVNVNATKYIGTGRSKTMAKNNAAEKALRDFVIAKMAAKARRVKEEKSIEAGEAEMKEGSEHEDVDDVPMLNLVSFALHKLFTEWEAEGFAVPDFRAGQEAAVQPVAVDNGAVAQPPVKQMPQPREELPANAAATHPTMLLSIMCPGTQFEDVMSEGKPPNVVHTVSVSLNGKNYVGTGRTKKLARKNAAMAACVDCYDVKFNPDIVAE